MTDPTTPADPKNPAPEATADTAELTPVPADGPTPATNGGATTGAAGAGGGAGVAGAAGVVGGADGGGVKRGQGPWVTVGAILVVLAALSVVGYLSGLGPFSRLSSDRGIAPPAKLAGLDRITDAEIRDQLQLDQTRDALSRINDGKQATVEAYGTIDGDRLYVIIALRGKVDIDKTVADSGAAADKIKKVGKSTCVEASGNLPTQCYRGSNTLTVIAQSANEGVTVNQVEPVTEEAYKAMR
jgi:hypothetical protein